MADMIPTLPPALLALIQKDYLLAKFSNGLRPHSYFRKDAERRVLEPHTGTTATHTRIGHFPVDLVPLPTALANPPLAEHTTEQWVARPQPFGQSAAVDAPTLYVSSGDGVKRKTSRLAEWAGRTDCRLARGKLYNYAGGTALTRRAQVTGNTVLLLNTLSGFRYANGVTGLVPVSATTPLKIKIGGADNTVVGVTPINANFPDGPGAVTLGTALAANVAAQTVVTASNRPYVQRAGGRTSTETLVANDYLTVHDVLVAREHLQSAGVPPHEDGTYHLHADGSFSVLISKDDAWKAATQGMGPSPAFGDVAKYLPALNLTVFESNDSPAQSRGLEVKVGSLTGGPNNTTGVEPSGAAGTPGASLSMQDLGLDVVNSSGVKIRRALLTGAEILVETYVDQMLYWEVMGIQKILDITPNVAQFQMPGTGQVFTAGEVEGWLMLFLPATDPRALVMTMTVSKVFDYTLSTDLTGETGGDNGPTLDDKVPLKRAVALEYAYPF